MDRQPKASEQVLGDKNTQPVSETAVEKAFSHKIESRSEKVPGVCRAHSPGCQFLFGASKKVIQPDGVLCGFPPGAMGRQVNRNTVIVPYFHEFPDLVFQDKIHTRPPSCQMEMVIHSSWKSKAWYFSKDNHTLPGGRFGNGDQYVRRIGKHSPRRSWSLSIFLAERR